MGTCVFICCKNCEIYTKQSFQENGCLLMSTSVLVYALGMQFFVLLCFKNWEQKSFEHQLRFEADFVWFKERKDEKKRPSRRDGKDFLSRHYNF